MASENRFLEGATSENMWHRALLHGGLSYLMSRFAVFLGSAIVAAEMKADDNRLRERLIWGAPFKADPHARAVVIPRSAVSMVLDVLTSWDGIWYMRIVRYGYPSFVPPNITFGQTQARVAFFPAFPYLVRVIDRLLPGGDTLAALSLNFFLGALFIVCVGVLTKQWFGVEHARKAMILSSIFPGSFVLSFAYSEALLLVLAATCLICIQRERWVLAGIAAMCATAARPNGIAVAGACLIAAVLSVKRERTWSALAAPLLAPIGLISFQIAVAHRAGENGIWLRVQREAWDEGASFGFTAIRRTLEAFTQPLTSPTDVITAASFLAAIFLVVIAWRSKHLPPPAWVYSGIIVALMLLPSTVTARPRFLYTAFPLLIAAAVWLNDTRRKDWWPYVFGLCLAGLTCLSAVYGVFAAVP